MSTTFAANKTQAEGRILTLGMVLLLACSACASEPVTVDSPSSGEPLSLEEGAEFGRAVQEIIARRDATSAFPLIDYEHLCQAGAAEIPLDPSFQKAFTRGYLASTESSGGYTQAIIVGIGARGSFRLLRAHERDGGVWVLFRLIADSGGVSYWEFLLLKKPDGSIVIADVDYGERASERVRGNLLYGASVRGGLLGRLSGENAAIAEKATKRMELVEALREGNTSHALKLFEELPEELKHGKEIQVLLLQASAAMSEEERAQALRAIQTEFVDDPFVDALLIDSLVAAGKYAEALESADRLDANVGGDPFLNVLRGRVHFAMRDVDTAKSFFRAAIDEEPDLREAYLELLNCSLEEGDHRQTTALLRQLRAGFGVVYPDMRSRPEFQGYVDSAEFQTWLNGE